jgi:glycosyltransferase involved in cell wall biosynthesis
MKDDIRVSIITPSFNQANFIERTIQSVLTQDYPNIEYIIVDGGSTDGTAQIIKKYNKKINVSISEPDRGQTDAINKGFERASGQILAWLNSDDTYESGAIHRAVAYLRAHPNSGAVYADVNFIDEHDHIIGRFPAAQTDYQKLRRGYVHIPQQSCFFRAELWKKVGPLDPSFYFAMDYDLWVRISKLRTLDYNPGEVWANFRLHKEGKTITADDRCWPEMLNVHFRDGGKWFSPIVGKYYLRKMAAPLLRLKRYLQMRSR